MSNFTFWVGKILNLILDLFLLKRLGYNNISYSLQTPVHFGARKRLEPKMHSVVSSSRAPQAQNAKVKTSNSLASSPVRFYIEMQIFVLIMPLVT